MYKEKLLIDKLKKYVFNEDNICYFVVDLINKSYNPLRLAELARKENLSQRLGYLAEVSAESARVVHLNNQSEKLTRLYRALEDNFQEWQHLQPNADHRIKEIIKSRTESGGLNGIARERWKIYSTLDLEEVERWIDLYITQDFLKFRPEERDKFAKKGIKHTRLVRRQ